MSKLANEHAAIDLSARRRRLIVSLLVDVCDYDSAAEAIIEMARSGRGGYVCAASVHMTMEAFDDPKYAAIVNAADLVVPDGRPLSWMQRLSGESDAAQVRGPSLMPILMQRAAAEKLKVGFYGGQRAVLDALRSRASVEIPRLNIAFDHSPPFRGLSDKELAEITEQINKSGVQILFVGLGCPKQERWMAGNRGKINAVMIGVGAAFDFYAGSAAEAPSWMRRFGLEWLFRLAAEPRRLWRRYLVHNPRFIFKAVRQLIGSRRQAAD